MTKLKEALWLIQENPFNRSKPIQSCLPTQSVLSDTMLQYFYGAEDSDIWFVFLPSVISGASWPVNSRQKSYTSFLWSQSLSEPSGVQWPGSRQQLCFAVANEYMEMRLLCCSCLGHSLAGYPLLQDVARRISTSQETNAK